MEFRASTHDAKLVSLIAANIIGEIGKPGEPPDSRELSRFFRIYSLDLEIGSGANFDQYFNWCGSSELREVVADLKAIGLHDHVRVTQEAIDVVFPSGEIPEFEDASLDMDWTESQTRELERLYNEISHLHGVVTQKLAEYATDHSLIDMPRFRNLA
jgi:hypothetical protein